MSSPDATAGPTGADETPGEPAPAPRKPFLDGWPLSLGLMAATWWSVLLAGQAQSGGERLIDGWRFAVPLMSILTAHEFGHYIAARLHRVDISPPYFIPAPFFTLLGTMGAVISMRDRIRTRKALLDIGAAGPLAGMAVALPVLWYGVATSPVGPGPERGTFGPPGGLFGLPEPQAAYLAEGHSLLYELFLYIHHGVIPEGHDIHLNGPALAGWAGLLVTMINLIPFGQLDGGHIAYALHGEAQDRRGRKLLKLLPLVALGTSAYYVVRGLMLGHGDFAIYGNTMSGLPWLMWFGLLWYMARRVGYEHPPTGPLPDDPEGEEDAPLGAGRRAVAYGTLLLFVLLFMPAWMRMQ